MIGDCHLARAMQMHRWGASEETRMLQVARLRMGIQSCLQTGRTAAEMDRFGLTNATKVNPHDLLADFPFLLRPRFRAGHSFRISSQGCLSFQFSQVCGVS